MVKMGKITLTFSCLTFEPPHEKSIGENKSADQLRGYREADDQRLCFHYTDSTIPLLSKSKVSSH